MSVEFTDKEIIRSRISVATSVFRAEAQSENPDMARMAVLERQIAADQKVLADLIIAESERDIELKKLELEAERTAVEKTKNDIETVRIRVETKKSKMEWLKGIIQIGVMAVTSVLAVALPVIFDYYKENRIGERFLLSQATEQKTAYLTQTDKELVRQGLQDTTGARKSILPWK